jgi:hypothetical protein
MNDSGLFRRRGVRARNVKPRAEAKVGSGRVRKSPWMSAALKQRAGKSGSPVIQEGIAPILRAKSESRKTWLRAWK